VKRVILYVDMHIPITYRQAALRRRFHIIIVLSVFASSPYYQISAAPSKKTHTWDPL